MSRASYQQSSTQPTPTPLFRLSVVLLAILQFVAPTWHICEKGGNTCCKPKAGSGNYTCTLPKGAAAPGAAQGNAAQAPAPHCNKCEPNKPLSILQAHDTVSLHGTCLAQLLESMPGNGTVPPVWLTLKANYTPVTPASITSPRVALLRRSTGRGPPSSIVS